MKAAAEFGASIGLRGADLKARGWNGIAINTGFLFAHPFRPTHPGQRVQIGLNIFLQAWALLPS